MEMFASNSFDIGNATNSSSSAAQNTALQAFTVASFSFNWVLFFLWIVMLIVFHKEQPVKSRFLAPLLVSLATVLSMWPSEMMVIAFLSNGVPVKRSDAVYAVYLIFRMIGLIVSIVSEVAYALHLVRYLCLRTLLRLQQQQFAAATDMTGANDPRRLSLIRIRSKRISALRLFLQKKTYALLLSLPLFVISPLFIVVVCLALWGGASFKTFNADTYVMYPIYVATLILGVALPTVAVVIVDVLEHRQVLRKGLQGIRQFLIEDDPLLFRIEALSIFPLLLFGAASGISIILSSFVKLDFVGGLTAEILVFLYYLHQHPRSGMLVSCAALYNVIKRLHKRIKARVAQAGTDTLVANPKKEEAQEVRLFLQDPAAAELFLTFARGEFSHENVICWQHIETYKSMFAGRTPASPLPTDSGAEVAAAAKGDGRGTKADLANFIFKNFVAVGSTYEINVENKQREQVRRNLESGGALALPQSLPSPGTPDSAVPLQEAPRDEEVSIDVFAPIEVTLMYNLQDTFARFSNTAAYRKAKRQMQQVQQLMKTYA